jgi:RNA polymerase sigma-70 factor (ECF subfamily)
LRGVSNARDRLTGGTCLSSDNTEHLKIFREHRGLLFAIAYRMLGSVMDAEDILQESYLAWSKTRPDEIESPAAFLRTIVTRRCIDLLKSARVRRETYVGPWLPEPLLGAGRVDADTQWRDDVDEILVYHDPGPEVDGSERDESLSTAFLILLESLNPVERAVYLLREVFDVDFAEIAVIVDRSADNCRQILHRARTAVGRRRKRFVPERETARQMLEQFLIACRSGDMQALTNLLTEDVRMYSDGGGRVQAALNVVGSPDHVARFHIGLAKKVPEGLRFRLAQINGAPGLLARFASGEVFTMSFDFTAGGRIQNIYTVLNPEKLGHIQKAFQ